jgi:acyl carrier protein
MQPIANAPSCSAALSLDECAERVMRAISKAQRLPLERLVPEATFAELEIGSLDAINLVFVLEDEFGIVIPEAQMSFQTIGEVVVALQQHLCRSASEASEPTALPQPTARA